MLAPANRAQTVRSEPSEVEEKIVRALRGTMYQPALNPLSTRIGAPCCRFRPRLQSFSRGFITPDSNQSDDKVQLDRTRLPRLTWMMSLGLITTNRVAARAIFSYFVKRGASRAVISGAVKRRRIFRWSHSADMLLFLRTSTHCWHRAVVLCTLPPDGIIVTRKSAVQIGCCAD